LQHDKHVECCWTVLSPIPAISPRGISVVMCEISHAMFTAFALCALPLEMTNQGGIREGQLIWVQIQGDHTASQLVGVTLAAHQECAEKISR